MKLNFNFEAKVDTIIRALRAGGYLLDNVGMQALQGVEANSTESERNNLVSSINYATFGGGGSGTNFLISTTNVDSLIDSDDTNPGAPDGNYFRVSRGQSTLPLADPHDELFTVQHNSGSIDSEVTIGARGAFANSYGAPGQGSYQANFFIGSEVTPTQFYPLYSHFAWTSINWIISRPDLLISAYTGKSIKIATDANFFILGSGAAVRGGWVNSASTPQFFVGEDPVGLGGSEEFTMIEKSTYTGGAAWRMLVGDNTREWDFFLSGSYPAYWDDARVRFCIGGVPGEGNKDPGRILLFGNDYVSQCMILTPEENERRMGLWVYHRGSAFPNDTHLNNFHTALNLSSASDTIRLFSVSGGYSTSPFYRIAFSVRADSSCSSPGGFFTEPADLAEYFDVPNDRASYEPGTVMVMDEADGNLVPSNGIARPSVMGVVSTQPGVGLGRYREDPTKEQKTIPLAMSGTVPTKCRTTTGSIRRMDLLVSDLDGYACKAPENPPLGSILGKAMENLDQDGDDVVSGVLKVLIWRN